MPSKGANFDERANSAPSETTYNYTTKAKNSNIENSQGNLPSVEKILPFVVVQPQKTRNSDYIESASLFSNVRFRSHLQLYHPLNSALTKERIYSNFGIASAIIQAMTQIPVTIVIHEE